MRKTRGCYYIWKGKVEVKYLFGFLGVSVVRENYINCDTMVVWTKDLEDNCDYRCGLKNAAKAVGENIVASIFFSVTQLGPVF